MNQRQKRNAEKAAVAFASDPASVTASFIRTAKTFPAFPRDILIKMVFEGWTASECALEHAARNTVDDYKPFSISRDTLRRYVRQGRKAAATIPLAANRCEEWRR